jgi:hypothetical protein
MKILYILLIIVVVALLPTYAFGMQQARPPDFSGCDENFYHSTACEIVHDLTTLPTDAIRVYGLSDQPDYVIKQTLNLLDVGNLTKVLQNISPQEISKVRDKITNNTFDTILSKVPEPQRHEIINKLSVN